MIRGARPVVFTVAPVGTINTAEVGNGLDLANEIQGAFVFHWDERALPVNKRQYRFPNGGYDLDSLVRDKLPSIPLPRPLILLTGLPYGVAAQKDAAGFFLFADEKMDFDHHVSLVSTYLWDEMKGDRPLQTYLLLMLAMIALVHQSGLPMHHETHGCLLDYCDNPRDLDKLLRNGFLCEGCDALLQHRIRSGVVSVAQIAAIRKLVGRAVGRKICFVAMPFATRFRPIYDAVAGALRAKGWSVARADEVSRPRRITEAIVQGIMMSDLVVADLTRLRPNVLYELGWADALGCDVVLLSQDVRRIPVDLAGERALPYTCTPGGVRALVAGLRRLAGSGRW